ncbi:hypothetical protein CORC01_05815 [Colletotrichum orchidophilum]|uniref:Uncharacterized protein n=1 Tax=Colletotrichum orchidophilum TaxID=1209926 RepID=A0A1G4BBY3_9PEZI|nr:uncharacterized protein CORC01_05815 [Colletotrichum orchidophilum]OHE98919.1 hypothetical protein CORC01_05815 [Colletotrichum orchidophilum]
MLAPMSYISKLPSPPSRAGAVHSYSILGWGPTVSSAVFSGLFSLEPVSARRGLTHST